MIFKKSGLTFMMAFVAIQLLAAQEAGSESREPIIEKTSAVPVARTPVFVRFFDEGDSSTSIQFKQLKPKVYTWKILPGDRRKIVEIPRKILKTSQDYDLKGVITLPDGNLVNTHILLKRGTLYFSVLSSRATEKQADLYKIAKPAGEEVYVFGNWRITVKFFVSVWNATYHTIEIFVEPVSSNISHESEEEEEQEEVENKDTQEQSRKEPASDKDQRDEGREEESIFNNPLPELD